MGPMSTILKPSERRSFILFIQGEPRGLNRFKSSTHVGEEKQIGRQNGARGRAGKERNYLTACNSNDKRQN